jgi:hypothetical protein
LSKWHKLLWSATSGIGSGQTHSSQKAIQVNGSGTTPVRALIAGAIASAALGLIQWLVLRLRLPSLPIWWIVATSAGIDLNPKCSVFGVSGALTFRLVTGLALYFLLRSTKGLK